LSEHGQHYVEGMTDPTPAGDFDYETRGAGYSRIRRADPRIEILVHTALGDARSVLNVGAGAGSYEPDDRYVVAVEPSASMRSQRAAERVPAVVGVAEALPFDDDAFDASMAMVTVHQWPDLAGGLAELRRVTRGRVLILTFDGDVMGRSWLGDYAAELVAVEQRRMPPIARLKSALGPGTLSEIVPIPADCHDGFAEAYLARPEELLRDEVRRAQSAWGFLPDGVEHQIIERLGAALASGEWDERFGHLRTQATLEGSLRLVVAPGK
jgi:hypothetical protein